MKREPVLIIMAAGMGSRYGGLKQIDKVSDKGEIILDFSLYDAYLAGFEEAIFVIRKEHEKAFRELMDNRAAKHMNIRYAFQELDDIPEGYEIPEGREKPWGTCHAVMSARDMIDGPFAVINADDYYGAGAFHKMYDFLSNVKENEKYHFSMVGYLLEKTLTENGHVARGICEVSDDGKLVDIVERTKIMNRNGKIMYTENEKDWTEIPEGTVVSMNFWGFTKGMMEEMVKGFPLFFKEKVKENPLKAEYFLPGAVDVLLKAGKAEVDVLKSTDKWYGVTYSEDKETVVNAIKSMKDKGLYPEKLWK